MTFLVGINVAGCLDRRYWRRGRGGIAFLGDIDILITIWISIQLEGVRIQVCLILPGRNQSHQWNQ